MLSQLAQLGRCSVRAPQRSFCRARAPFFFAPKMKRVGKDDVPEYFVWAVVGYVDRGIKLKVARHVAGETDGG